MKITFIGGGKMGEAMIAAILNKGLASPEAIVVSDISEARRQHLKQEYGVNTSNNNRQAVARGDVVVLAIKPQNLMPVMADLNESLKPSQLVLSIIAGGRTNTLSAGLNHSAIVRSMPNTPAQIGEGMSVWTATPEVTETQKAWAQAVLGAMGKEIYVTEEKYIDMATAVSGSGPAYFFLMIESLTDAATHIGLPRDIAQELALETMLGSGHLLKKSGKPPAELRQMVTSPGGTTAAALTRLAEGGFTSLILQAVTAAYNRAKELGN